MFRNQRNKWPDLVLFVWCYTNAMANDDQNILDVVVDVSRDLRRNKEFTAQLYSLDDERARRVAKAYIDFLYRTLEIERTGD